MLHRPLALVFALILGDYLLWNWSLGGSHELPALISGLTLAPLAIAFLWLSAVAITRMVTHTAQRSRTRADARARSRSAAGEATATAASTWKDEQASAPSSSKLAA